MNKFLILGLFALGTLSAWEDHPDRDEDRRNEASDSQCYVQSGYDWKNRDPESTDREGSAFSRENEGTVLSGPDRDK